MLASNIEYLLMRLIRKFLFNECWVRKLGFLNPYYNPSQGEISPLPVVEPYEAHLRSKNRPLQGKRLLELGSGRTNGAGYELAARGAAHAYCLDPFMPLDPPLDAKMRAGVSERHRIKEKALQDKVTRLSSPDSIPDGSIDIILSHSVLEHIHHPEKLLPELVKKLASDGCMLHLVDYRDHFFKYPFHFLQFSKDTWDRYLDPGDMPRWRLSDHLRLFEAQGLSTSILDRQTDAPAFARIQPHISPDFDPSDPTLDTTWAVLFARKR